MDQEYTRITNGIRDAIVPDVTMFARFSIQDNKVVRITVSEGANKPYYLKGKGLGGRNQELALAAAPLLEGLDAAVFSLGSDGTDGPTDAAGGYTDGDTMDKLKNAGVNIYDALDNNDAYHALQSAGGLIVTGPTGTNVNDVSILLIHRKEEETE